MRVVRERHQHRGGRLQQIRTEIAEVRGAELRRAQEALRARAYDHGAHPRLVETVAHPHDAHCPGWRFDRRTSLRFTATVVSGGATGAARDVPSASGTALAAAIEAGCAA